MWAAIKLFGGKFLKTKAGGFISNFFGGWQLYLLLSALFGGYIWNINRKLNNALEEIVIIQSKLDKRDLELLTCQDINAQCEIDIDSAIIIGNECADQWKAAKDNNELVISALKQKEKGYESEIEEIKKIKPVTDCDNESLNKSDADWLLGKNPNS